MLRKVTHHPYMSGGPPHGAYVVKIRQIGAHNHLVEKLACEGRFCVLPWSATPQPAATNRAVDLVGEFRDARKVVPLVADGIFAWIEHGGFTGVVLGLGSLACVAFRNTAARHDGAPGNRSCEDPEGIGCAGRRGGLVAPYMITAPIRETPNFQRREFPVA